MKQIHIRRFLSLLLAALTLWAAAVTAGSDSAAAALQQLRQGSRLPQQALRWELGDFFGLDSLSAVTVMTLAQSPHAAGRPQHCGSSALRRRDQRSAGACGPGVTE